MNVELLHGLAMFAAAFVGDCLTHAPVACEAHVSISLVGNDATMEFGWGQEPADIALLAPSIAPLPGLCALARDSIGRRERTRSAIMAANLLCVAGAFAFGFTPLAVVLVTNFGTSLVYNNAKRALNEPALARSWPAVRGNLRELQPGFLRHRPDAVRARRRDRHRSRKR